MFKPQKDSGMRQIIPEIDQRQSTDLTVHSIFGTGQWDWVGIREDINIK